MSSPQEECFLQTLVAHISSDKNLFQERPDRRLSQLVNAEHIRSKPAQRYVIHRSPHALVCLTHTLVRRILDEMGIQVSLDSPYE